MAALELRSLGPEGWRARLALRLERRASRTVIGWREHAGPLLVQRPFHPEADGTCHVYVLHPPGGVVGGDVLELDVEVEPGACALVTTPAATKLYRSTGATSVVQQRLLVRSGAALEWLPQETIAFGGSRSRLATEVVVEPGGRFLGWEVSCLGRPASGDGFESGSLDQRFSVSVAGHPRLVDRMLTEGGGSLQRGAWGWGGRSAYGCFVAVGASQSLTARLREVLTPAEPGELAAVTEVAGITVCRFLGAGAEGAKLCLRRAWSVAREHLLQKPASVPRIWST